MPLVESPSSEGAGSSEIALIGTGVAPLMAAAYLLSQDKRVIVLNPDWDFFLEDSELPLDPLLPFESIGIDALRRSDPERALAELRPQFPGAVEFWSANARPDAGFHDSLAPHIRQRSRLWATTGSRPVELEDLYLAALEGGLSPKLLEGVQAANRFPGATSRTAMDGGLLLAKSCDFDVNRYRIGLLEFVRERLGPEKLISAAQLIEFVDGGLRFHTADGTARTAKVAESVLVFWTPRLTSWVLAQANKAQIRSNAIRMPLGVRLWEQWTLMSKDPIDPTVIGNYSDMAFWAEVEGPPDLAPGKGSRRLSVLRAGPLKGIEDFFVPQQHQGWASADAFESLAALFGGLLKWPSLSVRSMRPRATFEWKDDEPAQSRWSLGKISPKVTFIGNCDGPLSSVVSTARSACDSLFFGEAIR